MLYTIVNPDEVLAVEQFSPQMETMRLGSRLFEGMRDQSGFVICRMISTDPSDYLQDSYAPGRRLKR